MLSRGGINDAPRRFDKMPIWKAQPKYDPVATTHPIHETHDYKIRKYEPDPPRANLDPFDEDDDQSLRATRDPFNDDEDEDEKGNISPPILHLEPPALTHPKKKRPNKTFKPKTMDKKKKHKLPKDILELIKHRNSLFKQSQELFRKSRSLVWTQYYKITEVIDFIKKVLHEFFKHHEKKSPESKNAYRNLQTQHGIPEAYKLYDELHAFAETNSISTTYLSRPKFTKSKSYHPNKIL